MREERLIARRSAHARTRTALLSRSTPACRSADRADLCVCAQSTAVVYEHFSADCTDTFVCVHEVL